MVSRLWSNAGRGQMRSTVGVAMNVRVRSKARSSYGQMSHPTLLSIEGRAAENRTVFDRLKRCRSNKAWSKSRFGGTRPNLRQHQAQDRRDAHVPPRPTHTYTHTLSLSHTPEAASSTGPWRRPRTPPAPAAPPAHGWFGGGSEGRRGGGREGSGGGEGGSE